MMMTMTMKEKTIAVDDEDAVAIFAERQMLPADIESHFPSALHIQRRK